jgi:hypothetical protein
MPQLPRGHGQRAGGEKQRADHHPRVGDEVIPEEEGRGTLVPGEGRRQHRLDRRAQAPEVGELEEQLPTAPQGERSNHRDGVGEVKREVEFEAVVTSQSDHERVGEERSEQKNRKST